MMLAIIQARFSSTRLPGKVMKPLVGRPMIERQVERVCRAKSVQRVILATSDRASDDVLARLCEDMDVGCFRGSLEDVLDRYYRAVLQFGAESVVRLTGDCPLVDPDVIDRAVDVYMQQRADYVSNTIVPTYPDGLDVEVLSVRALECAWREAALPSEREHVTPFIYKHPDRFRLAELRGNPNLSTLRWTVDAPEDFEFVRRVYEALYPANPEFRLRDILALLEREPSLQELNAGHRRNEGYQKSLTQDRNRRGNG